MFKNFITFVSFLLLLLLTTSLAAQQPQNTLAPIVAENAKYANGVAPGYAPTSGTGLNVNISSGTANCGGTMVTFTGAAEALTANSVNYVYLNTTSSCAVSVKTTSFVAADIPIAIVTTGSSGVLETCNNNGTASPSGSYPCIIDDRTMFNMPGLGTGSPLNTKGDLYGFSTTNARVPVGADGTALIASSGQALGVQWQAIVNSLNSLTGAVNLVGDSTISVTPNSPTTNELQLHAIGTFGTTLTPPISGQYVFIPATTFTPSVTSAYYPAVGNGSSGVFASANTCTGSPPYEAINCSTAGSSSAGTWSGYALPSYVSAANVTAVYAVEISSLSGNYFYDGTFGADATIDAYNGATVIGTLVSNPSQAYSNQQQTVQLTTITGSTVPNVTITASVNNNYNPGVTLTVNQVGLLVYYTGTAPPATPSYINVNSPLYYNAQTNSLGIGPDMTPATGLGGYLIAPMFNSTMPTGQAPFKVASTTPVANLAAQYAQTIDTNGAANQVWGMNSAGTAQGWQTGPSGITNAAAQYSTPYYSASGSSTVLSGVANGLTGQEYVSVNGAAPSWQSPGLDEGNGGADVTTNYTVQCDSSTSVLDRGRVLRLNSASTFTTTVPDPTTSGCGNNFYFGVDNAGSASQTITHTSTANFYLLNGGSEPTAVTNFTVNPGESIRLYSLDNANYQVVPGGLPVTGGTVTGPLTVPTLNWTAHVIDCSNYGTNINACVAAGNAYATTNETGSGHAIVLKLADATYIATQPVTDPASGVMFEGVYPRTESSGANPGTQPNGLVPNGGSWIDFQGGPGYVFNCPTNGCRGNGFTNVGLTNFTTPAIQCGSSTTVGCGELKLDHIIIHGIPTLNASNYGIVLYNSQIVDGKSILIDMVQDGFEWHQTGTSGSLGIGGNTAGTISGLAIYTYTKSAANGNNATPCINLTTDTSTNGLNLIVLDRPQCNNYNDIPTSAAGNADNTATGINLNAVNFIDIRQADIEGPWGTDVNLVNTNNSHIGMAYGGNSSDKCVTVDNLSNENDIYMPSNNCTNTINSLSYVENIYSGAPGNVVPFSTHEAIGGYLDGTVNGFTYSADYIVGHTQGIFGDVIEGNAAIYVGAKGSYAGSYANIWSCRFFAPETCGGFYYDDQGASATTTGFTGIGVNFNWSGVTSGNGNLNHDNFVLRDGPGNMFAGWINTSIPTADLNLADFATDHVQISSGIPVVVEGAAVASASTITPTGPIFHVTGTTAIATINAPTFCSLTQAACSIRVIPDGAFTTTTGGNIALASTAVVDRVIEFTYDGTAAKWYPSY